MENPLAYKAQADEGPDSLDELCSRLLRISAEVEADLDIALVTGELNTVALLEQLPDFVYVKDRRGRFAYANAAARMGRSGRERNLVGKTDFDILEANTALAVFTAEQEIMATGNAVEGHEERILTVDGRLIWLTTSKTPLRNADGVIVGLVGISRDITERKRQDDLRHGHARLLEMIARGQSLSTVLTALVRLVETELDGIMASVLLLDEDGRRLSGGVAPSLPEPYVRLIDGFEIGPRRGSCGTAAWRRAPVIVSDIATDPLWSDFCDLAAAFELASCWSTPIMGPEGRVLGTFALYSKVPREPTAMEMEVTAMATDLAGIAIDRADSERRFHHMAHHDPLTGLPNRALFWTQFGRTLHEARRERRKVTVAYIDLDNFKQINDTFGHAAGDEVLRVLSGRMANCVRASDLLVRLGGDEFAIVFSNPIQDELGVLRRLNEVRAAISQPVSIETVAITPTCSMGVAFFPQDGETPEELLARADRAMYEAKDLGRDRLRVSGGEGG